MKKNQRATSSQSGFTTKKLQTIEKMLSEEQNKRKKLASDIDEVKSNLSRFREFVKWDNQDSHWLNQKTTVKLAL